MVADALYSVGLIPAHAGKTILLTERKVSAWAHPRSRGENLPFPDYECLKYGSSPLTRGKLQPSALLGCCQRLIPAHAGKTCVCVSGGGAWRAHPRSRGENRVDRLTDRGVDGSSPLTRGKLFDNVGKDLPFGLIPAHAGKTSQNQPAHWSGGAHPRSRGENSDSDGRH